MVEVNDIATYIQSGLNALTDAEKLPYKFAVIPMTGDYVDKLIDMPRGDKTPVINAALVPLPSSIVPVKNLNHYSMAFQLNMPVQLEYAQDVDAILRRYIEINVGTATAFGEYVGVVNFELPVMGAAAFMGGLGQAVPISMAIDFQLMQNAIYGNDVQYSFISGTNVYPVLCLAGTATKNGSPAAYQRMGATSATNINTQSNKSLKMRFFATSQLPYTDLIQAIIGNATQNKVYKIRMKIGDLPEYTTDYILTDGSVSIIPGSPIVLECTFVPSDAVLEV